MPYEGDVDFVVDSGITNVDPGPLFQVQERPPDDLNIKQTASYRIYPWFSNFTSAGEAATIATFRPDGSLYTQVSFTTGENFGGANYVFVDLPATPSPSDLGTWHTTMTVNGVQLGQKSFVVSTTGARRRGSIRDRPSSPPGARRRSTAEHTRKARHRPLYRSR